MCVEGERGCSRLLGLCGGMSVVWNFVSQFLCWPLSGQLDGQKYVTRGL